MPRFLFWNYRYDGHDREELLARLVHEEEVDVLILAESSCDPRRLIDRLSSNCRSYRPMRLPHPRIQIYVGYSIETFANWFRNSDRLCLRRFQAPKCPEIILGAVHLESGLHTERSERASRAGPEARMIREAQSTYRHTRTIIVGDFNLNPFDDGMVFPEGFGAMMTKALVKKHARSRGNDSPRFYNPIWSRLGREADDGPPGTYYWMNKREHNTYWNYVDQVLVGHDLLDQFPENRFRILTSIPSETGSISLIRETNRHWKVEVSDHLPLLFDLDLFSESDHG